MLKRFCAALFFVAFIGIPTGMAQEGAPATPATPLPLPAPSGIASGFHTLHNDFYWVDQNGVRIETRSGCLREFNHLFYWYGGTNRFHDQTCYTSSDLVHWTNKGIILHLDVDANRMDVLYNESTKTYIMFLKYFTNGAFLGIATSPTPDGPFTFKTQTLVENAKMGDMSVFQDSDGTAYLCYVSWAVGTNAQHGIYRMSENYQQLDKRIFLWDIRSREAPHIFKRNNLYYYGTSRTAGIQSSGTSYYTATQLSGPWSPAVPLPTPGSNNSWDSQVDFIYPFEGSKGTLYMFAGDRWLKDAGRQGDYVWLPLEFDTDGPTLHYYQDWELNMEEGTWRKFDPARNLALGKAVSASSTHGDNTPANVTAATTYENYADKRWESAIGDPQWISVDLGAPTEINRVILKWGTTCAKTFKIQVSSEGEAWQDVFSTTIGAPYSVNDETFPTIAARYVRMAAADHVTQRPQFRRARPAGSQSSSSQPRTQAATSSASTQPMPAAGLTLFSFQVLKD